MKTKINLIILFICSHIGYSQTINFGLQNDQDQYIRVSGENEEQKAQIDELMRTANTR